jgi:hypothetical protein
MNKLAACLAQRATGHGRHSLSLSLSSVAANRRKRWKRYGGKQTRMLQLSRKDIVPLLETGILLMKTDFRFRLPSSVRQGPGLGVYE